MATTLAPERWRQVKSLLAPALDLSAEELTPFLEESCTDPDLRKQVREFYNSFHLDREFLTVSEADEPSSKLTIVEGQRIGAYLLKEKIGEGGMGEVFVALQECPIRRTVALKLIRPALVTPQTLIRFHAERQTLALMSHPNIAQIFDAGEGPNGRPYVVMELIVGQPITEYCDTEQLTIRERLQLFSEVCQGARHAHRKGVIHRDLKANNILVTVEEKPVPKIIDFGIAKVLQDPTSDASERASLLLTEPGQWLGTPEYMSPEQADGAAGEIDIRSDVYSLGVLLYELLCGRRPLELPDPQQAGLSAFLKTIRQINPLRPSERLSNAPEDVELAKQRSTSTSTLRRCLRGDLDHVCLKVLAKDPSERYESAGELADDIHRYLNDEPLLAAPPSGLELTLRWIRRHRIATSAAVLFLISLAIGILGTTSGLLRARQAEKAARAQAEKAQVESQRAQDAASSAQQITDFLVSILSASDPTQSKQSAITLREVLDNSAQRARNELSGQPLIQARLMLTMSYSYKSLGSFALARDFAEEALVRFRQNSKTDRDDIAEALFASSEAYFELGEYDTCLRYLEESLELRKELFGPDDVRLASVFNNLGMVYRRKGELALAREALEQALKLRKLHLDEDDLNIALTLDNLGLVLNNLGENKLAAEYLEHSLYLHEKALGPEHPELSHSLNNLALVRLAEGQFEGARSLFERALSIDRKAFGADHPHVATGLFNLGFLAKERGDCPTSLKHFLEAQAILQDTLPPDNWKVLEIAKQIKHQLDICPAE